MKKIILSILILVVITNLRAQDFENETEFNPSNFQSSNPTGAELYIKLADYAGKFIGFYNLTLSEQGGTKKIPGITDSKGNITFNVTKGKTYSIDLEDTAKYCSILIPLGYKSTYTKRIIYTPPSKYYETRNSTDTVRQNITKKIDIPSSEVLLKLVLKDGKNATMQKKEIRMYCKKYNKLYLAITSSTGEASLLIPANSDFVIGIDELESFSTLNTNRMGGGTMQTVFTYIPVNFTETSKHDTISQQLPAKPEPTSARVFISVKLTNPDKEILVSEPIFFKSKNTGKIYRTLTNNEGIAYVLVPKGDIYHMSFKYESNVDVLEYPYDNVMRKTRIEYVYIGSKKVEEYYASIPKKQGFLTEFMSKKVEQIKPFSSSIVEKTNYGYNLNFNTGSDIGTPSVYKDDMFLNTGFYKPELYAVNPSNGDCKWGVKLAENGISPVIYEDDVMLANTQSCTLYAIDTKSGNLLWSKWLGPVINSTPTVSKGFVYTCYPRNVNSEYKNKDSAYVLVSFNLKSGAISWQKWLDGEIVGAPVVAGNSVYVTTDNESLFQFEKNTGKQIAQKKGGYISAPTIVNEALYVFKRDNDKTEGTSLVVLASADLKSTSTVAQIKSNTKPGKLSSGSFHQMNFNTNRIVHYKGKNYCINNGNLFCFNKSDNKILWQKKIYDPLKIESKYDNVIPVASGGQIVIASPMGQLLFFDAVSGNKLQEYKFAGDQLTDAITRDGWIYCGTSQGKIISFNTKNKNITGWPNWSGNNDHNPVFF